MPVTTTAKSLVPSVIKIAAAKFSPTAVATPIVIYVERVAKDLSIGQWLYDNVGQILGAALGAGLAWWAGSSQVKRQWAREQKNLDDRNRLKTEHFFEDIFHTLFSTQAVCRMNTDYIDFYKGMDGKEANAKMVSELNRLTANEEKVLQEKYGEYREFLPKPVKENMQLLFAKLQDSKAPIFVHEARKLMGEFDSEDEYTSKLSDIFKGIKGVVRGFIPHIEDIKLKTQLENGSMTYPFPEPLVMPDYGDDDE
jgi:hypothetical protein